mgnify:CR=1 FL=1|jgi:hypothetical protein
MTMSNQVQKFERIPLYAKWLFVAIAVLFLLWRAGNHLADMAAEW